MTRPTFPDRALLSPHLASSDSSSLQSPLSPRFQQSKVNIGSRRQSTASGLSEIECSGQEEVELPEISHVPGRCDDEPDVDAIREVEEAEREIEPYVQTGKFSTISSVIEGDGLWPTFRRFWIKHISIRVDTGQRRDHLALERTFLGYLRTSLALSFTGVVIAQLLRLDSELSTPERPTPNRAIGGVALSGSFMIGSIVILLMGAIRFWRQQVAMANGKCWAGGPEMLLVWTTFASLAIALFVILLIQPEPTP